MKTHVLQGIVNQLSNILDKSETFKESAHIFNSLETGASDR